METENTMTAKTILKNQITAGDFSILDFKLYFRVIEINTAMY